MKTSLTLLVLFPWWAHAAPTETAAPQQDLKEIRQQINTLKKDVQGKEVDRAEATDALRESEQAISEANHALHALNAQQQHTEQSLGRIHGDMNQARSTIQRAKTRLARVLKAQYLNGEHDALALVFRQQDPNQTARDLAYYQRIAKAQQAVGERLKTQLAELERLSKQLDEERAQLNQIATQRAQHKTKLEQEKQSHQAVVVKLSGEIKNRHQQIDKLHSDEKSLSELIDRINREIEARRVAEAKKAAEKAAEAKRKAAEAAAQAAREEKARQAKLAQQKAEAAATARAERAEKLAAKSARKADTPPVAPPPPKPLPPPEPEPAPPPKPKPSPAPSPEPEPPAEVQPNGKSFASLQGKMRLPVRGELIGRFGTPRAEGMSWRGIFIRSAAGQTVSAIGEGRVVYADWLRGFGNMLIIDHGGGYMSLYGNGESLLKRPGDKVRAGDKIATTGNSGGSAETGLYFEIRHLGRPLNPASWVQ